MNKLLRVAFFLCALCALCGYASAEPKDAVVRIPSHGGSGCVISTGPGWSLILSAGHCFEKCTKNECKPIVLDIPFPMAGSGDPRQASQKAGVKLLQAECNDQVDLSLLFLNHGPLPHVTHVAGDGFRAGSCISVGYDEMALPCRVRPATILAAGPSFTFTRERPWHGRSGGALIDVKTGLCVGICSGYEGPRNHLEIDGMYRGVYASNQSILEFLRRCKSISMDERRETHGCPNGQCFPPFGAPFNCPNGQCPKR
jgi:hypothetical protein